MSRYDDIRRIVGKPKSNFAKWGHVRKTKHMQRLDVREVKPEHCMYYVWDRPGRVCGDTDTQYDIVRSVWLCQAHRRAINSSTSL